jgi:hypothetical protein
LERCTKRKGIGDREGGGDFLGAMEEGNEFVDSILYRMHVGMDENEERTIRDGLEASYFGAHGELLHGLGEDDLAREKGPTPPIVDIVKSFPGSQLPRSAIQQSNSA